MRQILSAGKLMFAATLLSIATTLVPIGSAGDSSGLDATQVNSPRSQQQGTTQPSQTVADDREPITWDHVYGTKRISVGGGSPVRYTWISDKEYLVRESSGWTRFNAVSGESSPWYDAQKLAAALMSADGIADSEAQRMAAGSWRHINRDARVVVFERGDSLIRISLEGEEAAIVRGLPAGRELEAFSPTGSGVAFVKDDELWVADFTDSKVRQLTTDAAPDVRNGKADWVYFEEIYNRKWDAFRWSPDGRSLAYQQFNDTQVPTFTVVNHSNVKQVVEVEHFPQAGDTNPTVRLGIVALSGGPTTWVDTVDTAADDLIISHFNWLPDSKTVYWYAQNRIQSILDLVHSSVADGRSRKLLRDQTTAWVDNPGDLTFLSDGSFLMFSERTGWRHLYRVAADGTTVAPVTTGEWEVRSLLAVSSAQDFALVSGTKDSHIAENIYRVTLDPACPRTEAVQRLTPEDGSHSANTSLHGGMFVDSWSSLTQPTSIVLRDSEGTEIRQLHKPSVPPTDKYRFGEVRLQEVPMADNSTTEAIFVFPPDFDPTQKYPVWILTYGGPHHPNVKNSYSGRLQEQLLANQGIVVVRFDPRSASGYGARSAWLAYRQLGVEETKDLVSVCDWLEKQGWADTDRIGMSGHSYGGYFTAYAMTHCDKLCAGIAGAPVTAWEHYDTIYTERFMSTPQDNPDGYRKASVVRAAGDLHGKLLLLHGLMDDNVHPENSLQLMHQLQRANKTFEVMFYPTARHGIFGSHYDKMTYNFIVRSLGKPESLKK